MNQLKHTPGPWMAFLNIQTGITRYAVATHTHTGIALDRDYWPKNIEPSCDEDGYCQPDANADISEQKIADARLIAAAPDLLVALQDAIGIVQAAIVNARNRKEYSTIIEGLERREAFMRATIAKATSQ